MRISVKWPARGRVIPVAAESIVVSVNQGTQQLAAQTIPRPSSGGTSSVEIDNLPPVAVSVIANACPNADGSGNAQATGVSSVTLAANSVAQVSLTMGSTVTSLTVSPASVSVTAGKSTTLSATATDAAGNVVLVGSGTVQWVSSDATVATVDASGLTPTVRGIKGGLASVQATFTEVEPSLGQVPVQSLPASVTVGAVGSPNVLWTVTMPVNSVFDTAVSPNGQYVAALAVDGNGHTVMTIYAGKDGKLLWTNLSGQFGRVLAFSPDGSHFAVGNGQTVEIHQLSDFSMVSEFATESQFYVSALDFSPDGTLVAAGTYDDLVEVHRLSDGSLVPSYSAGLIRIGGINCLRFSPDGQSIVYSGETSFNDAAVLLQNGQTSATELWVGGTSVNEYPYSPSVAFSRDGTTIYGARTDGSITEFSASSGQQVGSLAGFGNRVAEMDVSNDGQYVLAGGTALPYVQDQEIREWSSASGQVLNLYDQSTAPSVTSLRTSAHQPMFVYACSGGEGDGSTLVYATLP